MVEDRSSSSCWEDSSRLHTSGVFNDARENTEEELLLIACTIA